MKGDFSKFNNEYQFLDLTARKWPQTYVFSYYKINILRSPMLVFLTNYIYILNKRDTFLPIRNTFS